MKTKLTLFIISIFFLSACTTTYYSSIPYDDVYYNAQNQVIVDNSDYNEIEVYEGEYIEEVPQEEYQDGYSHFFDEFSDYYNYLYSSRLRRFHRPYYSFGYYNNYFTNMYWYELNPYAWGTSIYLNSSWMLPFGYTGWPGYYGNFGWGFGGYNMGWPYSNYGWPYYGSNYYGLGFGYGYNSFYGHGYGYGYGSGYYYNSLDRYSLYYKHRPTRGRIYNRPNRNQNTFGEMYEQRTFASRQDRSKINNQRENQRNTKSFRNKSLSIGTPDTGRDRSNRILSNGSSGTGLQTSLPNDRSRFEGGGSSQIQDNQKRVYNNSLKTTNSNTINTRSLNQQRTNKSIQRYQKPIQKYSKPNTYNTPNTRNSSNKQFNAGRSITNPNARFNTQSSGYRSNMIKSLKRVVTSPARSTKSYSNPSRSGNRNVSTPVRSSGQRSYSVPARSSGNRSYSSPSRSSSSGSRSISSGSRSSRSSGTFRSSGSSSGSSSRSSGSSSGSRSSSSGSRGKR